MEDREVKEFADMPGTRGFPLVGSALQLASFPEKLLLEWGNEHYGNVFRFRMFRQDCVVLNGYKAVKEGLVDNKSKMSGRITGPIVKALRDNKGLFFLNYGELWRKLKPFTVKAVGAIMGGLYEKINDQADKFLSEILEYVRVNDKNVALMEKLSFRMARIVFMSFLSKEFTSNNNEQLEALISDIYYPFRSKMFGILMFSPGFSSWPFFSSYLAEEKSRRERVVQKFVEWIEKRHDEVETRSKTGDIVKIFYEENPEPSVTDLEELALVLVDMIFAGTLTVTHQILWVLLFLLKHPDMMDEAQSELDNAMKEHTSIADLYKDRQKVPFLRAAIQESLRLRPIAPGSLYHKTVCEAEVAGFKVPKDVVIVPNLWSVHHDPEIWKPDPETFRPDRHLDEEGKFKPSEHVIPFSIGDRRCAGEEIARSEIFIFIATILYRSNFRLAPGYEDVDINGERATILQPPEFLVTAEARKTL